MLARARQDADAAAAAEAEEGRSDGNSDRDHGGGGGGGGGGGKTGETEAGNRSAATHQSASAAPAAPAAHESSTVDEEAAHGRLAGWATRCLEALPAPRPSLAPGVYPGPLRISFAVPGYIVDEPLGPDDPDPVEAARAAGVSPEELARVVDQQSRVVTVRATVVASLSARQGDPVTPSRPLVLASPGDTTLADLWRRGRMPGRAPPQGLGLERDRAGRTEDEEDDAGTPRLAPASGASPLRGRVAVPGSAAAESGRVVDLYDAPFSEEVPADGAPGPAPGTARDAEPPRAAGAARAAPVVAGFAQGTNPTGAVPPVLQSSAESVASLVLGGRAAEARLPGVVNDADPLSSVSDDDEEFDEEEEAAAAAAEYGGSGVEGAVAGRAGAGRGATARSGAGAGRPVALGTIPPPGPPTTVFVRAVAEGRDGRVSAVSVSRFALLQPLQHLFRCVLPPKLARLEGRVVAAVGSASLDDALAVHPHVLRRKLKALGVRKKDRDAIVAGMRPLRDAAGHGEGARPYLQAVAAAEQAGLP